MKLKLITIVVLLFSITSLNAQVFFHWSRTYDSGTNDAALDVSTDAAGLIHELGTRSTGPFNKLVEAVYNSAGDLIVLRLGNKHLPGDIVSFVRDTLFNTYLVTNHSGTYNIVKYGSDLKEKWSKVIPAEIVDVRIGPDQKPTVGGKNGGLFFARKYNPTNGSILWTVNAPFANGEKVAFNIDLAGFSFLAGTIEPGPGAGDISIFKISPSGVVSPPFIFPQPLYDEPMDIYFDLANFPYLDATNNAGTLAGTRFLMKFNNITLIPIWAWSFGAMGGSGLTDVANIIFDPANNPNIVGTKTNFADPATPSHVFVQKRVGATGTLAFETFPDDPALALPLNERALTATRDVPGNIYFGGYTDIGVAPGSKRWLATKVNWTNGLMLWTEAGYGTDEEVNDLLVTPALDVYLAATDADNMDLIKYSQTGPPRLRSTLEENSSQVISVYPNPSSGIFNIHSDKPVGEIQIFSVKGDLIETDRIEINESSFGENLPNGNYFLKLSSGEIIKVVKIE